MTSTPLPLLKSMTLQGFLSFGPDSAAVELGNLNVLIGPNGSGKSNFVEALAVLRAAPGDLPLPIREGGGVRYWIWNGGDSGGRASVDVVFNAGLITQGSGDHGVRYRLEFGVEGERFTVLDERIEVEEAQKGQAKPYFYFGYENGHPTLNVADGHRRLRREDIDPTQSILSQRRDPDTYPELTRVADALRKILVYRSWTFGPDSPLRRSCPADVQTESLAEDFSNLPARLSVLKRTPIIKARMISLLKELAPGFEDFEVIPEGGQLQLYLQEGTRNIPARRPSDGTLRFLCLLAILIDPKPSPLIVVEEPELGLHPDILPVIRDLMVEASEKCQLIVTTHSTQLVDSMTEHAECVLICEKGEAGTVLSRLSQEEVDDWRDGGGLGNLWMSGQLGGTRW